MRIEDAILMELPDGDADDEAVVGHVLMLRVSKRLGTLIDAREFERKLDELEEDGHIHSISQDGRPAVHASCLTLCTMPLYRGYVKATIASIVPPESAENWMWSTFRRRPQRA